MDIHKAYQILQADPNDSDQSIESRYEILHSQHKSKADLAPNEHLREKFNISLQDLEIAYAKVIRYRNGSDSPDTKQLPITNAHLENKIQNYEKEEGAGVKSLKKEVEKLNKNFKYAFFASVFFLATAVLLYVKFNDKKNALEKLEITYKEISTELEKLKAYEKIFSQSKNLKIKNNNDMPLTIKYLKVWYVSQDEENTPKLKSIEYTNLTLSPGEDFRPTFTKNNTSIELTNWVYLYTTVQIGDVKLGQGLHCDEVKNGEWSITTK